jgi:hypothetical protein
MFYETGRQVDAIAALPTVTAHDARAADCDIPDMFLCWSRYVRELRTDQETARGHPDEDVLVCDLRNAEAYLAGLLAIVREQARAA